jgi:hypothetical protein
METPLYNGKNVFHHNKSSFRSRGMQNEPLSDISLICMRTTSAIRFICQKNGIQILNYLDDLAGCEEEHYCNFAFDFLGKLLQDCENSSDNIMETPLYNGKKVFHHNKSSFRSRGMQNDPLSDISLQHLGILFYKVV